MFKRVVFAVVLAMLAGSVFGQARVQCGSSERFGSQLIRVGDSERRVMEVAGRPDLERPLETSQGGGAGLGGTNNPGKGPGNRP